MSRPIVVTVSGRYGGPEQDGASQVVPVDRMLSPFSLAIGCKVEGSAIYQVEHTYDDVYSVGFRASNAQWHLCPVEQLRRSSHGAFGGYFAPPTAIRVRIIAGNGLVIMTVIHGGMSREVPAHQPRESAPETVEQPALVEKQTFWNKLRNLVKGT